MKKTSRWWVTIYGLLLFRILAPLRTFCQRIWNSQAGGGLQNG